MRIEDKDTLVHAVLHIELAREDADAIVAYVQEDATCYEEVALAVVNLLQNLRSTQKMIEDVLYTNHDEEEAVPSKGSSN